MTLTMNSSERLARSQPRILTPDEIELLQQNRSDMHEIYSKKIHVKKSTTISYFDFYKRCFSLAAKNSISFANNWSWLLGVPTLTAIFWFVGKRLFEGAAITFANTGLGDLINTGSIFLITWFIGFAAKLSIAAPKLYREKESEVNELREELHELTRIHFLISIESANISIPTGKPNTTALVLNISIDNKGTPSIAKNWCLSVAIEGQPPKKANFMRLGVTEGLNWSSSDGRMTTIPNRDALEDKTENTNVNGRVRGQLWFIVDDISHDKIVNLSTKLILSAEDKYGKVYSVTETIENISKK